MGNVAKREELEHLIDIDALKEEGRKTLRDLLLEIVSTIRSTYETTVAQARDAETIEQVALLWKETHTYYAGWLDWWDRSRGIWFTDDPVYIYLAEIKKLERASREHYEFHA